MSSTDRQKGSSIKSAPWLPSQSLENHLMAEIQVEKEDAEKEVQAEDGSYDKGSNGRNDVTYPRSPKSDSNHGNTTKGPQQSQSRSSPSPPPNTYNIKDEGGSEILANPLDSNVLALPPKTSTDLMPSSPIKDGNAATGLIIGSLAASLNFARKVMTHSISRVEGNIRNHLKDSSNYEHINRPKRWWEFVLLFSVLTGIEFVHAVEAIFVNPLLLAIGIPATFATMIWSVSPILGLVTVPLLGSLSDKCSSKMGRRRPFIIFFSVGITIGLLLLTFGPNFSVMLGDTDLRSQRDSHVLHETALIAQANLNASGDLPRPFVPAPTIYPHHAIVNNNGLSTSIVPLKNGSTVILYTGNNDITKDEASYKYLLIFICLGVIIMDYSADSGSSPAMSYMLDITLSVQHTLGLTIGTSMTGTGGLLGYLIGFFDWETIWPSNVLRNQFQIVFMMALVLYIITAALTLTSFKEMPLYHLNVDKAEYAQRMSISRPWNYGSNRKINRRYGSLKRGQAQSLCLDVLKTESARNTLETNGPRKQDFRMSLPDLRYSDKSPVLNLTGDMIPALKCKLFQLGFKFEEPKPIDTIEGEVNKSYSDSQGNLSVPKASASTNNANFHLLVKSPTHKISPLPRSKYKSNNKYSSEDNLAQIPEVKGKQLTDLYLKKEPNKDTPLEIDSGSKNITYPGEPSNQSPIPSKSQPLWTRLYRKYSPGSHSSKAAPNIPIIVITQDTGEKLPTIPENDSFVMGTLHHSGITRLRPSISVMTKSKFQGVGLIRSIGTANSEEQQSSPKPKIISTQADQQNNFTDHKKSQDNYLEGQINPELLQVSQLASVSDVANTNTSNGEEEEDEDMSLGAYLLSIVKLPRAMAVLCFTHLLCWMAFLCFATYFSDFVGQSVFKGSPTANPGSPENLLYEAGVRFSCVGMFLYALTCILYSTRIKRFAARIGTKRVYIFGIFFYCCSMAILGFAPFRASVVVLSPAAGIIQASLLSIPFIFVSMYHDSRIFERVKKNGTENGKKVFKRGIGTDIAVVSSMVFWAQLIISLTMGKFIDRLNSTKVIPFYGCGLSLLATLSALWITDVGITPLVLPKASI